MSDRGSHTLIQLDRIDARLEPFDWAFATERRSEIEAHWAMLKNAKPALFNGRVLLQHRHSLQGRVFKASYFATEYANFVAQRVLLTPPFDVRNGFAMAALRARDGAFLLGEMAGHTHNAGRIYFPAGTPDMSDVIEDGTVDLSGSAERELAEETGLQAGEVTFGNGWIAIESSRHIAFMRPVTLDLPAQEARKLILSRLALQTLPELSDIHIVRKGDALEHLPDFMQVYLEHAFQH